MEFKASVDFTLYILSNYALNIHLQFSDLNIGIYTLQSD